MPILPVCSNCNRKGGFAEKATDKICKRCKNLLAETPKTKKDKEEEKSKEFA